MDQSTVSMDVEHLRSWIGREEKAADIVSPQLVRAFQATIDAEAASPAAADPIPPGLHWCLAPATVRESAIGPDGHPARGGFLPPVPLPRRMWAGGRLYFKQELRVADEVERISTVKDVTIKQGRAGMLCFVLVEHRLTCPRGLALVEEQDIVYRGADAAPSGDVGADVLPHATVSLMRHASPVLLFRYSALTFNGHRIHYDRAYAQDVEGYPGLVVHGPLQATLLLDIAWRLRSVLPKSFSFRAVRPLFDKVAFTANGAMTGPDSADLWIASRGEAQMRAAVAW
jgi:3-methylfumaryl-CoA hydratase